MVIAIRVILIVAVLAGTCLADTSPRLDSIRLAVLEQLNLPATGSGRITTGYVDRKINEGIQAVSTNFPAVEKLDTILVDSTMHGGTLPGDFVAMKWCALILGDTALYPLAAASTDSLAVRRTVSDQAAKGETEATYYNTHGKRLFEYPKYRVGYDTAQVLIAYYAVDNYLSANADTVLMLPAYREFLLKWVCSEIEQRRGNYDAAALYRGLYESARKERGL